MYANGQKQAFKIANANVCFILKADGQVEIVIGNKRPKADVRIICLNINYLTKAVIESIDKRTRKYSMTWSQGPLYGCRRYDYKEVIGRVEPGAETESNVKNSRQTV